jgi:hypothetical protein
MPGKYICASFLLRTPAPSLLAAAEGAIATSARARVRAIAGGLIAGGYKLRRGNC